MLQFLNDNFFDILFVVIGFVTFLVTFFRTGNVVKSISNFKETFSMYSTLSKRYQGQSFSETVPDYVLNPATNELERKEFDKNIQDKIQSYVDCALQVALDKLLPDKVTEQDDVAVRYNDSLVDLASVAAGIETAEHYRELLNLPDNYTISQIYAAVDAHSKDLRLRLEKFNKKEDVSNVEKKEVK